MDPKVSWLAYATAFAFALTGVVATALEGLSLLFTTTTGLRQSPQT